MVSEAVQNLALQLLHGERLEGLKACPPSRCPARDRLIRRQLITISAWWLAPHPPAGPSMRLDLSA